MVGLDPFFGNWVSCPGLLGRRRPCVTVQSIRKVALEIHFPMIFDSFATEGRYQSTWSILTSPLRREFNHAVCLLTASFIPVFFGV